MTHNRPKSSPFTSTLLPCATMVAVSVMTWVIPMAEAAPVLEQRALTTSADAAVTNLGQANWQLQQQMTQLQDELRDIRGLIETYQRNQSQAYAKLEKRLKQLDERLTLQEDGLYDLQGKLQDTQSPTSSAEVAPTNPLSDTDGTSLTRSAQYQADPQAQYTQAYDIYKANGAEAAATAMDNFISDHPTSALIPNAHYWTGMFYLMDKINPNLASAKSRFETVVNRYPTSEKAPEALFQLGKIAHSKGQPTVAKQYMQRLVSNYPNNKNAPQAQQYLQQ